MKKKMIIALLLLVVTMTGVIAAVMHHSKSEEEPQIGENLKESSYEQTVVVSCWNDSSSRYAICKVNKGDEVYVNSTMSYFTGIVTELSLEDMAKQNDDYVGDFVYYSAPGGIHDTKLFFGNNNHYVLYKSDNEENTYYAKCCYGSWSFGDVRMDIPLPAYMPLGEDVEATSYYEVGENILDYLFQNFTFTEASEFYERYTDDIAKVDEANEQIYISGYDYRDKKIKEHCICIDFQERTFTYDDGENEVITVDGIPDEITE